MKILAISGSPRGKHSQTRRMTEALLEAAKARGAKTELVDLGKAKVGFCTACELCHRQPGCSLKDDAVGIMHKMLESDAIVIASPVYLDHVSAQMKAMLDRTSHFIHCLRLVGKYFAAVTTSGGGSGNNTAAFVADYARTVGAQYVGACHAPLPLTEDDLTSARKLGVDLIDAIVSKRVWPDQERAIEAQRLMFGKNIAFHKEQWPYEYQYWKDLKWL
ncbi:MAG: flavodoxin family protein [Lentisphaerae bacterium]|jgi:multimeric flavodoxin WrbA|nr:flavodoxin family protein [Lentisphaerota bacterium]